MNAQECYEKNLELIKSIPESEITILTMPQEQVSAEAQQLSVVVRHDKEYLIARGLDPIYVDTLLERTGAFTFAAALYEIHTDKVSSYRTRWLEKRDEGYSLKRKIINEFRFAFRKNSEALSDIAQIKEGRSDKDMIIDLLSLYVLGNKHVSELKAISFDLELLQIAKNFHEETSIAYAEVKIYDNTINHAKIIRDKAYSWLKEAVTEIREYGRFVFQDDPEHQKYYFSEYYQTLGGKGKRAYDSDEEAQEEFINVL